MSAPGPSVRRDCQCPRAQHQHGSLGAYQYDDCRCFRCCLNRSQLRTRVQNGGTHHEYDWRSAIGVARRLQALSAIGYTDRQIGEHIGMDKGYVIKLRAQRMSKVTPRTFERIARVYDLLWAVPQIVPYATRAKRGAARKGWLPPLAWDDDTIDDPSFNPEKQEVHNPQVRYARRIPSDIDEIAVERAMRGDPVRLTKAERSEAFARLNRMGLTAREIGELLGVTGRTIVRKRSAAA